jgi:hypothetical protein
MSTSPVSLLTEQAAAQTAIWMLECGRVDEALSVLQRALRRRKAPKKGADRRSDGIVRLRAYIEQAIVELERGHSACALTTLSNGIKSEPGRGRQISGEV